MGFFKKLFKKLTNTEDSKYTRRDTSAFDELEANKKADANRRVKMFLTSGGAAGEEVENVKRRKTLLNN